MDTVKVAVTYGKETYMELTSADNVHREDVTKTAKRLTEIIHNQLDEQHEAQKARNTTSKRRETRRQATK